MARRADGWRRRARVIGSALGLSVLITLGAAAEELPLTRIAFGSCAHQERPQPIWDAILDYRPELFLFLGDNVYGDVTSAAMTELQAAYAKARANEGQRRLRASVPVLAIWDDHDYGRNDGGADFPYKAAAKALFLDHWQVAEDDPRRSRVGIYHARIFGPPGQRLQVVLLDTRSFRSPLRPTDAPDAAGKERYLPDPDPSKTMLGDAQWAWLEAQLRQPADLRLIVSSIQVLAEGHGFERWGNLPVERARLIDLIARTGAGGVVFLSGDRHQGAIYARRAGAPYPLHEITASAINMPFPAAGEAGPLRLGAVYGAENFGTVDIDWWAGEVTLAVRTMNGTPVRRATVPLASLRSTP